MRMHTHICKENCMCLHKSITEGRRQTCGNASRSSGWRIEMKPLHVDSRSKKIPGGDVTLR